MLMIQKTVKARFYKRSHYCGFIFCGVCVFEPSGIDIEKLKMELIED